MTIKWLYECFQAPAIMNTSMNGTSDGGFDAFGNNTAPVSNNVEWSNNDAFGAFNESKSGVSLKLEFYLIRTFSQNSFAWTVK